jgi:hypothetical protein
LRDEPFGVAGVGGGQDIGADGLDSLGMSIVDVVRGVPGDAGMPVFDVDQRKKRWQKARASGRWANVAGKSGRYLKVRNCASEYGLSLLVCAGNGT